MAEPLTANEERLLRFARSMNGGMADYGPNEAVDRLLATLDAERALHPVSDATPDLAATADQLRQDGNAWAARAVEDGAAALTEAARHALLAYRLDDTTGLRLSMEEIAAAIGLTMASRYRAASESHPTKERTDGRE